MPQHLSNSTRCLFDNEEASAIAHVFKQFEGTGTKTWHRKTVEWLLIYIMTEIGGTPHNIRKGYNCPSIIDAYDAIVHELVRLLPSFAPNARNIGLRMHDWCRRNEGTSPGNATNLHSWFVRISRVWMNLLPWVQYTRRRLISSPEWKRTAFASKGRIWTKSWASTIPRAKPPTSESNLLSIYVRRHVSTRKDLLLT